MHGDRIRIPGPVGRGTVVGRGAELLGGSQPVLVGVHVVHVCTDTGIYYQRGVEMPLLPMYTRGVRFVTGRVNARALIPEILEVLAAGCDLAPVVERVADWEEAPSAWPVMTGKTVFARA